MEFLKKIMKNKKSQDKKKESNIKKNKKIKLEKKPLKKEIPKKEIQKKEKPPIEIKPKGKRGRPKNPETKKILCLDWEKFNWKTFVIGGVEDTENPKEAAKQIKGRVAFWKGVVVN